MSHCVAASHLLGDSSSEVPFRFFVAGHSELSWSPLRCLLGAQSTSSVLSSWDGCPENQYHSRICLRICLSIKYLLNFQYLIFFIHEQETPPPLIMYWFTKSIDFIIIIIIIIIIMYGEEKSVKKLVQDAKKQETEDTSGEYKYRVRGTPGSCL